MTYSIPSDLAVLDWDGDGFADRVYAGDTGGQMWRFDLPIDRTTTPETPNGDKTAWSAKIIFKTNPGYTGTVASDGTVSSSADGSNGKKIFYRPAVARVGNHATLYFGTGDREHPLNLASADRMYMLFDRGQGATVDDVNTAFDETTIITEGNLVDVTGNELQNGTADQVTGILNKLYDPDNFGWYIRLENNGEKMLAPPVVFFGEVFYTTYAPLVGAVAGCEVGNLGISRLYHLDFRTGEAVFDYDKTNNSDDTTTNERAAGKDGEVLKKTDRVRTLGEGIPSGIVTLIDASGQVTMMISASNRVGTYQAPDAKLITPVYWMQWND
jgi:type IV pilus assembly protein PilY1